jgi:hypothetical protein
MFLKDKVIQMLIELNYIFLSLLLVFYCAWSYFRRKEKHMLYLAICFTFLTFSIIIQTLTYTWSDYIRGLRLGIPLHVLELIGLALFTVFTAGIILALRKTPKA